MHDWLHIWLGIFENPEDTFHREKKKAKYSDALMHYAVGGFAVGLLFLLSTFLAKPPEGYEPLLLFGLPTVVNGVWLSVVRSSLIAIFLFFFIKLLDGKGAFVTHYYLLSLAVIPVSVADFFLDFLTGTPGMVLKLAFSGYKLFLLSVALKEAHEFEEHEAFFSWFVPLVLLLILAILVTQVFSGGNALEFIEKYLV